MESLSKTFEDRVQEVDAYLAVLDLLEQEAQAGPPKIAKTTLTGQQQQIMYSSVYVQLYNLVEATATWCIDAVSTAVAAGGRWKPADLSDNLRREWVRSTARTHTVLNYDNRLDHAVSLCDWLIRSTPVGAWTVDKGGGGNWDDSLIEKITERIGCDLTISRPVYGEIKRKIRDDKAPLELVKYLRNKLAHGEISFSECGQGVTASELREIKNRTTSYLREVVGAFQSYIDTHKFLMPSVRPAEGDAQ